MKWEPKTKDSSTLLRTALSFSIVFHLCVLSSLIFSNKISLAVRRMKDPELIHVGAIQVDMTYKPTDTAMKLGNEQKDLPPPKVEEVKQEEPEAKSKTTIEIPKKKETDSKAEQSSNKSKKTLAKPDLKSILDKIRREAKMEERPKPKEDNFPVSKLGQKGAHGTGGRSLRAPSPAEQALQSAMRKYFELEDAISFRKKYPNVQGVLRMKLIGSGNQFQIAELSMPQSTGFQMLDKRCETAIRQTVDSETFAKDIISELSGKDTMVVCKP